MINAPANCNTTQEALKRGVLLSLGTRTRFLVFQRPCGEYAGKVRRKQDIEGLGAGDWPEPEVRGALVPWEVKPLGA